MPVDPTTFRGVLGQWPSGVTVVTTSVEGRWHGITASSFSSVSLDPPLIAVCLARQAYTHELLQTSGAFAVNILSKAQADTGKRFAGLTPSPPDRFAGLGAEAASTGSPVLADVLAWLDCTIVHAYPGGDHTIFVGEVQDARLGTGAPLLFHSRAWSQLADLLPEAAEVSETGAVDALLRTGRAAEASDLARALGSAGASVRWRPADGPAPTGVRTSVVAADAGEARRAADAGASRLEVVVDDPAGVARLTDVLVAGLPTTAVLPCAFGAERRDAVVATIAAVLDAKADEVCFDDGDGLATPLTVRSLLQDTVPRIRPATARVRLRDDRGLGLSNALTALKSGVTHFDSTLGGIDGVLASEDLLHLVAELEVGCEVDADAVRTALGLLGAAWPEPLRGRTGRATTATGSETP